MEHELQKPAPASLDPSNFDQRAVQLAKELKDSRGQTTFNQAFKGFSLALKTVKYLFKTPALWPSAAIPAIITSLLFLGGAGTLLYFSGDIFAAMFSKPDSWWAVLWWVGRVLWTVLTVGIGYLFAVVFGAILAGPFNDILSQRIERRVRGEAVLGADDLKANIRGVIRGALHSIGNLMMLGMLMVPILALNLIPGIGSLISSVLSLVVSSHFLAFEFMDWSLERREYGWRQKWGVIFKERPIALGFGLGASLLMWVPVINFAAMPVNVISGTMLALELDERKGN